MNKKDEMIFKSTYINFVVEQADLKNNTVREIDMNDERFQAYREKYPNQIMPPYGNKNIKDLGKIVDYLLSK